MRNYDKKVYDCHNDTVAAVSSLKLIIIKLNYE